MREPFINQISAAVSAFNRATWPRDLGLSDEAYPFRIWRGTDKDAAKQTETSVALGEVLLHTTPVNTRGATKQVALEHSVVMGRKGEFLVVQPGGLTETVEVHLCFF